MLGRALAPLEPGLRHWVQRTWGYPDIHSRQHWRALWPVLASISGRHLQVIDAGCGQGRWTFELAHRRPGWSFVGIDRDAAAIAVAHQTQARGLGRLGTQFVCTDVREFAPQAPVDLVLSVASAHYLAEAGEGPALFARYASWLKPGGRLVLLGPRAADTPFAPWLAHPRWHAVFSADHLMNLCTQSGLEVRELRGVIGRLGVLAKQLAWTAGPRGRAAATVAYPAEWTMAVVDRWMPAGDTLMWRLVAERRHAGRS